MDYKFNLSGPDSYHTLLATYVDMDLYTDMLYFISELITHNMACASRSLDFMVEIKKNGGCTVHNRDWVTNVSEASTFGQILSTMANGEFD